MARRHKSTVETSNDDAVGEPTCVWVRGDVYVVAQLVQQTTFDKHACLRAVAPAHFDDKHASVRVGDMFRRDELDARDGGGRATGLIFGTLGVQRDEAGYDNG